MATKQEIEKLKSDWKYDPCWDIENTEGFEDHKEELLKYRIEQEQIWESISKERKDKRCNELGIPGNYKLLSYLEKLEDQIEFLQVQIEKINR